MTVKLSNEDMLDIKYAHLGLDFTSLDLSVLRKPFEKYRSVEDFEQILRCIRDPKNFDFTCKHVLNIELSMFQLAWLDVLWKYPFPMLIGSRGASKTYTLAVYFLLRALITQGCKTVIASSAFRQAKMIFEYMETIWADAPVLRDLCGPNSEPSHRNDVWEFTIGSSSVKAVPLGTGEKIRGMRANYLVVDEFSSVSEEVFEVVLRGFTATASNPIENIKKIARIEKTRSKKLITQKDADEALGYVKPNQVIISGTTGWDFQHFSKYWKKYRDIIMSRGDQKKLYEIFGGPPERGFDWKDYAIIRVPVDLLPRGMMEEKALASSKATMDSGRYAMEYGALFSKDSNGFFKRSLIESCVTKTPIILPSGPAKFFPLLEGDPNMRYVMGVDPASENDNFAITIQEVWPDHTRLVYCWTVNRSKHHDRVKKNLTDDNNFYAFIARKIRNLMKVFNIEYIALDSQGGGIQTMESLHDIKSLESGELPIWPIVNEHDTTAVEGAKNWGYDDEAGLHIIHMVSMAKADYVVEANHGMRKDLEHKTLLFPFIDAISLIETEINERDIDNEYENMENLYLEIEELKEELSAIVHTTTLNGRDRWETPTIILPGNKKSQMRKDRYSSLLMCNSVARKLNATPAIKYGDKVSGGFAKDFVNKEFHQPMYYGPPAMANQINACKSLGYVPRGGTSSRG